MKHLNQQGWIREGKVVGGIDYVKTVLPDGTERPGYTWNPLGWGCFGGCSYCFARTIAYRNMSRCKKCNDFIPHFHPERLEAPKELSGHHIVFACDMSDLFGVGVKREWREAILEVMEETPHITYLTLTKKGIGSDTGPMPDNVWFGVSCVGGDEENAYRILSLAQARRRWVSFEPFLARVHLPRLFDLLNWVVIGPLSKGPRKIQPNAGWVQLLLQQAEERGIPVFMKSSLIWRPRRKEMPNFLG